MNRSIKTLASVALLLSLTACATVNSKNTISPQIAYAPAIDVPYSAVIDNVKEHVGVNVRWGGQIIGAEDVTESQAKGNSAKGQEDNVITRVTVIASPLSSDGKPDRRGEAEFDGGRFIVEMNNFHDRVRSRFITVYGPISGEETLTNGNKQITIPVIAAVETEDWNHSSQRYPVEFRHGLPYNGLGLRYGYYDGYGYSGSAYYGFGYGYSPYFYPYANYGHGRRIGRRGYHH